MSWTSLYLWSLSGSLREKFLKFPKFVIFSKWFLPRCFLEVLSKYIWQIIRPLKKVGPCLNVGIVDLALLFIYLFTLSFLKNKKKVLQSHNYIRLFTPLHVQTKIVFKKYYTKSQKNEDHVLMNYNWSKQTVDSYVLLIFKANPIIQCLGASGVSNISYSMELRLYDLANPPRLNILQL